MTRRKALNRGAPAPATRNVAPLRVRAQDTLPVPLGPVAAGGQALAVLLQRLRAESGLSTRRLAERAVVARSTVQRLERGQIRPRPSTLGLIASALDPDRRAEILGQLVDAAGEHIAPNNEAWSRYKGRRVRRASRAGRVPLPSALERAVRLSAACEAMWAVARSLSDRAAGVVDEPGNLFRDCVDLGAALREESDLLKREVGTLVGGTVPPRRRGDPVDVSPHPPPAGNLPAVRRWLWEWRVREGRLQPRSARERAIAETGARERQKVKGSPSPLRRTARYRKDGT